jgi:predicted amidohydrolase YtcJ
MSELYFVNGKFHTQDPVIPQASAVAIRNGRFSAVGSDSDIRALAGPGASVIDLEGRRVLPGLVDAHVHFYDWALGRKQVELAGTPSLARFQDKLRQFVSTVPADKWITGNGWNEQEWPEFRLPDRDILDRIAPRNPVILWRSDLHMAVVNTLALQAANVTAETPDPPQGMIDHDSSGKPTGILRDLAINLVSGIMPPPDEAEAVAAFKEGFAFFHRLGLTGVHDQRLMGGPEGPAAFRIWQRLQAAGEIQLRVWMNLPGERLDEAIALGLRTGFGDDRFRIGHLKYFADGGQGARTAWMLAPYEGTNATGLPLAPMSELASAIRRANQAGLAVAIHAIGDRANRELITVFENLPKHAAKSHTASPSAPNRIEHVQIIQPEDLQRLAKVNLVVSAQPIQVTDDIPMMEPTIGARSRLAYQFRSMWEAGIRLVFSSDCPVCNPNPFYGIHAAVTRQRRDGSPPAGWYPEQRLTVSQAVWGFSMGAAVVSGRQADLGSLSPGKLADMVVIDRDIFSIDPSEIFETKPVMTIFDGQVVYKDSE